MGTVQNHKFPSFLHLSEEFGLDLFLNRRQVKSGVSNQCFVIASKVNLVRNCQVTLIQ